MSLRTAPSYSLQTTKLTINFLPKGMLCWVLSFPTWHSRYRTLIWPAPSPPNRYFLSWNFAPAQLLIFHPSHLAPVFPTFGHLLQLYHRLVALGISITQYLYAILKVERIPGTIIRFLVNYANICTAVWFTRAKDFLWRRCITKLTWHCSILCTTDELMGVPNLHLWLCRCMMRPIFQLRLCFWSNHRVDIPVQRPRKVAHAELVG